MPPKKAAPSTKKSTPIKVAATSNTKGASKNVSKVVPGATKKTNVKGAPSKEEKTKPAEKKWTKEDEAARKIQTYIRGFLGRRKLLHLKKEKQDYESLMDKLERDACIAIAKQRQKEAEEEVRKEAEERKRRAEEKKRIKRMLEAAFDGDVDEMKAILREVKQLDDKLGIGQDVVGEAVRMKHILDMVDCEDAHGNTPLSEASSGGHSAAVMYLIELGCDPNSRGQFERTPLYRAAFAGHIDCCQTLLQHGADQRLYANDGQTPENVASIEAMKVMLSEWDSSLTDSLLAKIESEKERRREKEKARREAEMSELEREITEAQKEYDAHQKTLNSIYCELNKRIDEHDTAPAMGFQKPEITLQAIKDAEDQLEVAKLDYENSKEKIRELKARQRENMKEAIEADGEQLPGLHITIQELPDTLLRDVGNKIKDSGKWPLIIDTSNRTPTFLRYQDTNYINALMPRDMENDSVRLAILGALRYGKPFVLDMMEVDMFDTVSDRMSTILPELMKMIMDKTIMEEANYLKLVKTEDGPAYHKENFSSYRTEKFKFFIITKNIFPSELLMSSTFAIRIHIPE